MTRSPAVSVVLPTYCRAGSGHLARAIESLLGQDFDDFELIAVDDGSIDGTRDVLADFKRRDPRVHVLRLREHIGLPAIVVAHGHAKARGEIIAWLFDDCELSPQSLSKRVQALGGRPSLGMVYGRTELIRGNERDVIGAPVDEARLAIADNMIPNVTVMLRRGVIERVGSYDPHVVLKRLCDWDLWRRIVHAGVEWQFINEILATELGPGLANSIGRSMPYDMELVLRYAAIDRNARLQPAALIKADPFREDWLDQDDADARLRLRLLATDHCCRNGHFDTLRRLAKKWGDAPAGDAAGAPVRPRELGWVTALYRREREFLTGELHLSGVNHRKALAICDERQALLLRAEDALQAKHAQHAQCSAELGKSQAALATALEQAAAQAGQIESLTGLSAQRLAELKGVRAELSGTHAGLDAANAELRNAKSALGVANADMIKTKGELDAANVELEKLKADLGAARTDLAVARNKARLAWQDARDATLRSIGPDGTDGGKV